MTHYPGLLLNSIYKVFRPCRFLIFLFLLVWQISFSIQQVTASDLKKIPATFPEYEVIKPNVEFWKNIFSTYSTSQGVMHDSKRLDIVYGIIKLNTDYSRKSRKINKKRIKKAIKKYKNILYRLSIGKKELDAEELRIKNLFGLNAKPSDFKNAMLRIRCQSGQKEEFKRGLIRSGPYIKEFKRIFKSHGLPQDLTFMPCVESSFNFKAYSKFGAAGIWQFTRSTGKRFMKINYVVDERRDPFISTEAAAKLLKHNFSKLGNWPMAITAYNHGLTGMKRAKNKKGSYDKIFSNYRSRTFKFASRNFYSEFLAARQVAKEYQTYFGNLDQETEFLSHNFVLKGYLSVKKLTEYLKISPEEIKELNPALRQPVYDNLKYIPKGYKLHLPQRILAEQISSFPKNLYSSKQKPSRFHKVQKGDTAGNIARIHRVRLKDLILANNLNRRATIYVGQNIRIPLPDDTILLATKSLPQKIIHEKKPVEVIKKSKPEKVESKKDSIVKPLEVAVPETQPAVDTDEITNPDILLGNLKIEKLFKKNDILLGQIRVEAEETLGHYADWLEIPTQRIRQINNLVYNTPIPINKKLKIPLTKVSDQEFEERRFEYHKAMEEDFFNNFTISEFQNYKVQTGDNIWTLCYNKFEVPFWLLKKYNEKIDFNTLKPMQTIRYPVVSKAAP